MFNESTLIHVAVFAAYLGILLTLAGNVRVKVMRNVSSLIQLTGVLLCVDLLAGFFLIEKYYDSHESASWISKTIFVTPVLLLASLVWMRRAHKKASRAKHQR